MAAPMRLYRGLGRRGLAVCWGRCSSLRRAPKWCRAASAGAKSRLYDHARDGWTARPQIDVEALKVRLEAAERELESRKGPLRAQDLRQILAVWQKLVEVQEEIATVETEKNRVAENVRILVKSQDSNTSQSLPLYDALRKQGRDLRLRLNALRQEEMELDEKYYLLALKLPNRTHPDVPIGDESQAKVIETVGSKPVFDFEVKGHLELGEELGIIRQRRLSHVSGHRSYYLRGAGAILQQALVQFALKKLMKKGFIPMAVPDLLKGAVFVVGGTTDNVTRSGTF